MRSGLCWLGCCPILDCVHAGSCLYAAPISLRGLVRGAFISDPARCGQAVCARISGALSVPDEMTGRRLSSPGVDLALGSRICLSAASETNFLLLLEDSALCGSKLVSIVWWFPDSLLQNFIVALWATLEMGVMDGSFLKVL